MVRLLLSRKLGELRMSQAELARITHIRASTINDYYHGSAERVSLDHLDLICEALACELSDLLVREPNAAPRISHIHTGKRTGH